MENQCIEGLIAGEQIQVSLPAAEMSIGNPKGSHVPVAIREKIFAGAYIDLPLLLKQGPFYGRTLTLQGNSWLIDINWSDDSYKTDGQLEKFHPLTLSITH